MNTIEMRPQMALRTVGLLAVTGMLAIGGCKAPPTQDPIAATPYNFAANERLAVDQVFIVTDASSSMYSEGFAQAKSLTRSVIDGLPERGGSYDAALVAYGGGSRVTTPLAPVDKQALSAAAADLKPLGGVFGNGGSTPLARVLDEVAEQATGRTGKTAIILVSDGRPNHPARAIEAGQRLVKNSAGEVCIHTVQVGDHERGGHFNQSLASLTGCGSARTSAQITGAYDVAALNRAVFSQTVAMPAVAAAPPPACETVAELPRVPFEFDNATLSPEASAVVDRIAGELKSCAALRIQVGGHTDPVGTAAYNMGLSERRAQVVREQLLQAGVSESQLSTSAYGATEPVTTNGTVDGRAYNRRVEFTQLD